jgi:hypothetical protein
MGLKMTALTQIALAALVASTTCSPAAGAHADVQGWNGPGWYISDSASSPSGPRAAPAYILFEGPHDQRSDCVTVYNRLYSPIGACRFLSAKPHDFVG